MEERVKRQGEGSRRGVILLITLVILVILATLGYTLSAKVAARRHRDQYIIDYGQAKYACVSALKCSLASVKNLQPDLISRPNDPDFSDVFAMSEEEYQALLTEYGLNVATDESEWADGRTDPNELRRQDSDDFNDFNDAGFDLPFDSESEPATVPGPYGPAWPLVAEPLTLDIGSARVTVEMEDENAKYPLGWALIDDEKLKPLADTGFVTFCEWMGYGRKGIDSLLDDLGRVGELRTFKTEFKPVTQTPKPQSNLRSRVSSRTSSSRKTPVRRTTAARKTVSAAEQIERQSADFARLFHSSLVDTELLARPSIVSESRSESAMRYLSRWGTRNVNINTAPRQVLEAALTFGSVADAPKIAEAIIQQRRVQPFADIEEAKKIVFQYSDSIEKAKDFLTTTSTVYLVRVTATSGLATVRAVAAVNKEGDKVKEIGVISD